MNKLREVVQESGAHTDIRESKGIVTAWSLLEAGSQVGVAWCAYLGASKGKKVENVEEFPRGRA
jgi:hypothetical protein